MWVVAKSPQVPVKLAPTIVTAASTVPTVVPRLRTIALDLALRVKDVLMDNTARAVVTSVKVPAQRAPVLLASTRKTVPI